MNIRNVLHLADGRTVFAGEISEPESFVDEDFVGLFIAGKFVETFRIDGEMEFHPNKTADRAVSSLHRLAVDDETIKSGRAILRSIPAYK